MLILSRMQGEEIVIGEDVVVKVIDISRSGRVRLGIEAPRDVEVDRMEVREKKESSLQERERNQIDWDFIRQQYPRE